MNAVNEQPQWFLENRDQKNIVDFEPAFASNDFSLLQKLTVDGYGITLLPDYMCKQEIHDGRLIRGLDNWAGGKVDFHALVRSRFGVTPKIRVFLNFLAYSRNRAHKFK